VLNNSGQITNVKIGENGTAEINNYNYIKKITGEAITDDSKKGKIGMNIVNRGTIDYVLTGSESHNIIDNEGGHLALETGKGNESIIIAGQKGVSIQGGNGKAYLMLYNKYTGTAMKVPYDGTEAAKKGIEQLLKDKWTFDKPEGTIKEEKLKAEIDDYYKYAMEYYNDSNNNWFIPYKNDVKGIWDLLDLLSEEYNLNDYDVKLLKADAVFYSGNTVQEMSAEFYVMNSPKNDLEGISFINIMSSLSRLSSNKKALETRTDINESFKGFKFSNKGTVKTGTETFYRTMSKADYETFVKTGKVPATSETFISPTQSFSEGYNGVTVEFKVKAGTTNELASVGVRDSSGVVRDAYGNMPTVSKGWKPNNAYFKGEDGQINIGLGKGTALDIFNNSIVESKVVGGR
ncbi:MAG: hypothetical protein ACYDG2_23970, partial [Ruminiclostridium sp.]